MKETARKEVSLLSKGLTRPPKESAFYSVRQGSAGGF